MMNYIEKVTEKGEKKKKKKKIYIYIYIYIFFFFFFFLNKKKIFLSSYLVIDA